MFSYKSISYSRKFNLSLSLMSPIRNLNILKFLTIDPVEIEIVLFISAINDYFLHYFLLIFNKFFENEPVPPVIK